jgi:hypothetical protein
VSPPFARAVKRGDSVLWYLGPSALLLGVIAFVIIVLMSVFGAGSVLVWIRRGRRVAAPRRPSAVPEAPEAKDKEIRKAGD